MVHASHLCVCSLLARILKTKRPGNTAFISPHPLPLSAQLTHAERVDVLGGGFRLGPTQAGGAVRVEYVTTQPTVAHRWHTHDDAHTP